MISVLYAPLFTAVSRDGGTRQLGLIDLLSEAHLLLDLKANSCTGKFALYRLCIAFLSDAYHPKHLRDRADLFAKGCFDRNRLLEYVTECEAQGACFALDDEKRPFMQAAYNHTIDSDAIKPVANILFDCPSGNAHIHIDHRHEDDHEISISHAFESMLETYVFCTHTTQDYPSGVNNMPPPLFALIHGENLFETFVFNMISMRELSNIPFGVGEVSWLNCDDIIPKMEVHEMSFLRALTWQPRRVTLQQDADGLVRRIYYQQGMNFQGNSLWMDPHVVYEKNKNDIWISKKPQLGREVWRDAGTLISEGDKVRSTIPIINLCKVCNNRPYMDVEIIGVVTDKASVLGRLDERLVMPVQLLTNTKLADDFCSSLDIVEHMYLILNNAIKWKFCHKKRANKDKTDEMSKKFDKRINYIAKQAEDVFLDHMHFFLFGEYLDRLVCDENESQRALFADEVWKGLDQALKDAVETTGDDVPTMKRQNAVRAKVRKDYMALRKELLPNE